MRQVVFTERVNCCAGGGYGAKRKSEEGPEPRSGGGGGAVSIGLPPFVMLGSGGFPRKPGALFLGHDAKMGASCLLTGWAAFGRQVGEG